MREATGGALLIKIMLIFIAIYIAFLAVSINYSLAFRVKNELISIIEVNEGYNENVDQQIRQYLGQVGYTKKGNKWYDIQAIPTARGPYYKVTTYISFDFPVVGTFFTFPINGETRVLYNKM